MRVTEWTVFLKKGDGIQMQVVKADLAEYDDENGRLDFTNMKAGVEVLALVAALNIGNLDEKQKLAAFKQLLRKIGQIGVASFDKSSVIGYVRGRHESVSIGTR
jgi:hypothetical protein